MRSLLFSVVGILGLVAPAFASDPYCPPAPVYKKVTVYETRIVYETRVVAYTEEVTKYDCYGKPYTVCVTRNKTVEVPVKTIVAVTKLVKVSDY